MGKGKGKNKFEGGFEKFNKKKSNNPRKNFDKVKPWKRKDSGR